ncbi:MAG TPA: tetratricopeptide repeat protein [Pirellulales bacterium]|nr:tetratricopeptide repeat protein [Pirellulales bacterium]
MNYSRIMHISRHVGVVLLLATFVAAQAQAGAAQDELAEGKPADADAPFRHNLTGDDAELADELNQRIEKLFKSGDFADAQAPARELLKLRSREQGVAHWQTQDARRLLATLERAAGLEAVARAELAEAKALDEQSMAAFQERRLADAIALKQRVAAIYERHLGPADHETATALYGLAVFFGNSGRPAEAHPLHERSLTIFREALGEENPMTAQGYRGLAIALDRSGKYAQAEPSFRRALAIQRRVIGAQDPNTVATIDDLAQNLDHQGKYADAEPLFRQVLADRRQTVGEEHSDTASSCNNLAANLIHQGKYVEAEPMCRQALALRERLDGQDGANTATEANNLATCLLHLARFAEAEPHFRRALDISQRTLGEEHADTAISYLNLAANLYNLGQYSEAEPLYLKASEIFRKVHGDDHPMTAVGYHNLAMNLSAQGKHAEAEPLLRKALGIQRRTLGQRHPETANGYLGLAGNLGSQQKFAEAESLLRQALEIDRETLGDGHPQTGLCYRDLGSNLTHQGRYAEAAALHLRALAVHRRVFGEEHPETVASYEALAWNLDSQGKHAEAEPLLLQALINQRSALGEEHQTTAGTTENLAVNLERQRRFDEAETLHWTALGIWERTQGDEHPRTALVHHNLAANLLQQGKSVEAEPHVRRSLAVRELAARENDPDVAMCFNLLAKVLMSQGRHAEAQGLLERSLSVLRQELGERHPATAAVHRNLAATLQIQGKYPEAEAEWTAAAERYEAARLSVSFTGLDRAEFGDRLSPLPRLAACQARLGLAAQAWANLEANLARGLFDDLSARRALPLIDEDRLHEQALRDRCEGLEQELAGLAKSTGDDGERRRRVSELRTRRDDAQAEFTEFMAELARRYGPLAGESYDLAAIQSSLPDDAALVVWLDESALPLAADPNGEHWAGVCRRQGNPAWIKLAGSGEGGAWTNEDDELIGEVRQSISEQSPVAGPDWKKPLAALCVQRLKPLLALLGAENGLPAVRRLIVLPSRAMAGVPIEPLLEASGDGATFAVSYAPSCTVFAWLRQRRAGRPGIDAHSRLLALGDPSFARADDPTSTSPPDHGVFVAMVVPGSNAARAGLSAGDVLLSYGGLRLDAFGDVKGVMQEAATNLKPDLDGAQPKVPIEVWRGGEARKLIVEPGPLGVQLSSQPAAELARREIAIALLAHTLRGSIYSPLPGSRREVEAVSRLFPGADKLLGAEASRQRLDESATSGRLGEFDVLHFATHGELDERSPLQSALILSQADLSARPEKDTVNQVMDERRLTAAHILSHWKLNADLVVLSSCESGLGKYSGGEGFVGFSQALLLAGARSLVLSQWKVDDTATALLMVRFYENLLAKREGLHQPLPKAEALAEAKRWLRELSAEEVEKLVKGLPVVERVGKATGALRHSVKSARPFEHPYYWAAFILIGDPE